MKKVLKLGILFSVLLLLSGCGSKSSYLKEISYEEYKTLIENKETFALEIMRTDCSACQSFKPKLTQFTDDYQIEIKVINTDNLSEDEYNSLYEDTGISGTPTVIFYKEGIEETKAARINGSVSVDKLISKFKASGFIEE